MFIKRTFLRLALSCTLLLASLVFSSTSYSALVDVQQKNDVVYFLFAAPNKIARYDLASNSFLSKITLNNVPTAFHVNDSHIYIGYDKALKRTDLTGLNITDIYQTSSAIIQITSLSNTLFILDNSQASLINATDLSFMTNFHTNSARMATSSSSQNAIYYRKQDKYSNSLKKYIPAQPGRSSITTYSNYSSRNETTNKIASNTTGDKIYADSGFIFSADNLNFIGSLGNSFDHISFIDNKPLVLRGNKISLYDPNNHELGNMTLNHTPSHIAAKGSLITTFITTNSLVEARQTDIDQLTLPIPSQPTSPENLNFSPEFIISDHDNLLYLQDAETLAIHRRKITENKYASSWSLLKNPSWMSYSTSNKRLYLGYDTGKITYFDTTLDDDAIEIHLITLATPIEGLLAAGDFVYAIDHKASSYNPYIHYGIDMAGNIINYANTNSHGDEYLWSADQGNIHYWNNNYFRKVNISAIDGTISFMNQNSNQEIKHQAPLRLSPNGQLLLNGTGQIIGSESYTVLNNLTNSISDAAWVKNYLITILKDSNTLQIWQEDYLMVSQHHINNAENIRLFSLNEKLLIVSQTDHRPSFIVYDLNNIPDTDTDTINDLNDNCIHIKNTTQTDSDNDYIGDLCDSDNDNDLIPNTLEVNAGLNPLDASDANLDLDNDEFSNLIEFFYSTDINDINSKPNTIYQYSTSFDMGIPVGFYQLEKNNLWSIKSIENNNVLVSGLSHESSKPSSIYYTADFASGMLNFSYKMQGYNYNSYGFELYLDGVLLENLYSSSYWRNTRFNIESGIHMLEFRFSNQFNSNNVNDARLLIDDLSFDIDSDGDGHSDSKDNCPSIENQSQYDSDNDGQGNSCDNSPYGRDRDADGYGDDRDNCPDAYNPDQANLDNDYYGDACDDTDDRPVDSDQDGIYDYSDNCPNTSNPDQHDFDHDYIGDLCDLDIDNDGLSNAVENQYDFLNAYNYTDALLDQDNDGASNEYEINTGTQPDVVDSFTPIDLSEYFPLGNIDYFYISDSQFIRLTIKPADAPGRFSIQLSNDTDRIVERRASGIYLLSYRDNYNENELLFNDMPILPSSLYPGKVTEFTASISRDGSSEVEEISTSFYLKSVGETAWQGKVYPSVTIVENGNQTIYLKGIGPMSLYGLELDSVNLEALASPKVLAPVAPSEKSDKSGGHFNIAFLFTLLLLITTIGTRKKH